MHGLLSIGKSIAVYVWCIVYQWFMHAIYCSNCYLCD